MRPGAGFAVPFTKQFYMSTSTAVMTTAEIANRLVELCEKGDFEGAQKELFANDAVSIEPQASPAFEKETKGLDAIIEKGHKWSSMVQEVHGMKVSEPIVSQNSFAVTMSMNVTMKDGNKMDMTELCVYNVKDGKIASEHFFM
jgi:ketosteroid isomerase-like protein